MPIVSFITIHHHPYTQIKNQTVEILFQLTKYILMMKDMSYGDATLLQPSLNTGTNFTPTIRSDENVLSFSLVSWGARSARSEGNNVIVLSKLLSVDTTLSRERVENTKYLFIPTSK